MKTHKHNGINSIDYYSYISKINHWNPSFKIILAFSSLLICIIADNILISVYITIAMTFISIYKGKINIRNYLSLLKIPLTFMILSTIAIALSFSTKPVGEYNVNLYFFYLHSSNASILAAIKIIIKAFGAISSMYMVTLSTSTIEIISFLRRAHIPSIIIELMNMIYRFIFVLMDIHSKMKTSAKSRLGYVDFKTSCLSFGRTAGNLLILSIKKANGYYDAIESRCYNGEMLFLEEAKPLKISQLLYSVGYFIILIILWLITK